MASHSRNAWFVLAVVLSAVFIPGLTGPFLLDDWGNLEPLLSVTSDPRSIASAAFSNPSGLLHRPLSNLSFVINLLTTGTDPLAFKATNWLLHVLTGVIVFGFCLRILALIAPSTNPSQRILAAAIAASVWLVHPLQVSTVLYAVQRMAILSALFSMVAVACALRALASDPNTRSRILPSLALYFAATTAALLCKENGALTPLLLGTILLVLPTEQNEALRSVRTRLWVLAVGVPVAAGLIATAFMWDSLVGGFAGRSFSLAERLLTQPSVLLGYIQSIVIPMPSGMALFQDDTPIRRATEPSTWIVAAGLLALACTAFTVRSRFPVAAFAVFWFLGCHALESSFLPLELAFEHRNYLALLGPALLTGHLLSKTWKREEWVVGTAAAALTILGLASLTYTRAVDWSSEERFARSEVERRPQSIRAQNLAGIVERRSGDTSGPIKRMALMKSLYPNEFFPWAMDMDFACDSGSHPVNWAQISETALQAPGTPEVLGYFNHITLLIKRGECEGISAAEMDANLKNLASRALITNSSRAAQFLTVLRASLKESAETAAAREILHSALDMAPEYSDIWLRILTFELTYGDATRAREALAKAEALAPTLGLHGVRFPELRAAVERAEGERK